MRTRLHPNVKATMDSGEQPCKAPGAKALRREGG